MGADTRVGVRMDRGTLRALKDYCKRRALSLSQAVRRLVREGLERGNK